MRDYGSGMLANIRIVMVNPTHPGNIGAVARAMKTMGLVDLWLVAPKYFPHEDATARAAGAVDVLERARVVLSFDEAIADCGLVLGASARVRTISWPQLSVREAARQAITLAPSAHVAMVLGAERVGLTNMQLDRCHALVQIPANPEYASLNIAAAAQVIAYELRMACLERDVTAASAQPTHVPAPEQELERFYEHLRQTMIAVKFLDPENPRQLMRRVRRLFNRAMPDTMELNILRGILAAVDQLGKKSK